MTNDANDEEMVLVEFNDADEDPTQDWPPGLMEAMATVKAIAEGAGMQGRFVIPVNMDDGPVCGDCAANAKKETPH